MRPAFAKILLLVLVAGCLVGCGIRDDGPTVITFWAMGAEGERVRPLIDEFERRHPDIRVRLQQIPWEAAHEKLLTAYVGDATPDVCQLGNTWIPEFVALNAVEELTEPLAATEQIETGDYFPGIWQTNLIGDRPYGIPWYVDTRVVFYRTDILTEAGYDTVPDTWEEWLTAMRAIRDTGESDRYPILVPMNEFEQPLIFGLQSGATMLGDGGRVGAFSSPEFRRAFRFYLQLFEEGLAPRVTQSQISNLWNEFGRGRFAMLISGPWNVAEFQRRLPDEMDDKWSTAPMPAPEGPGPGLSNAGGCSLVIYRRSQVKDAAWKLVEFLSETQQQVRFYELSGNLPARRQAWEQSGLAEEKRFQAFHRQLEHVSPMPAVPEWEQIAIELTKFAEQAIIGRQTVDEALAALDRRVDNILRKRRWMLDQQASEPTATDEVRR